MNKHIIAIVLGLALAMPLTAETLYVFVPTDVRANALQSSIMDVCSDMNVTVFGRVKDFQNKIISEPPSAILSLLPVVQATDGFLISDRGERGGGTEEPFVIVSVDTPIDTSAIADKKIGVVDLLGRKPMTDFVSKLLKAEIKLQRVTKVEDLLPMLTFGSVDGIFISEALFSQLKTKSNLNLVSTKPDVKIGIATTAVTDEKQKKKLSLCVSKFDSELNAIIGVDKWLAQ